jgi:hypothetical protein
MHHVSPVRCDQFRHLRGFTGTPRNTNLSTPHSLSSSPSHTAHRRGPPRFRIPVPRQLSQVPGTAERIGPRARLHSTKGMPHWSVVLR